jgi:hypothetical protein
MSTVTIAEAKAYLRVKHDSDDALLQMLLDSAEDECLQYLDRPALPKRGDVVVDECDTNAPIDPASDSDDIAPTVREGILMIVQAGYEAASVDDLGAVRRAATVKWHPYRNNLGVG